MTKNVMSPQSWQQRADEARSLAEQAIDRKTKRTMRKVAEAYDRLTLRAESLARTAERAQERAAATEKARKKAEAGHINLIRAVLTAVAVTLSGFIPLALVVKYLR
jgi:thioesterase domain-containing protein